MMRDNDNKMLVIASVGKNQTSLISSNTTTRKILHARIKLLVSICGDVISIQRGGVPPAPPLQEVVVQSRVLKNRDSGKRNKSNG